VANYPNQKRITVGPRAARNGTNKYCMYNLEALQQAMAAIKTVGGIKIWMYINKNQDHYTFDLSRAELLSKWGLTKDTYDSGLKELIKLGYLTPINGNDKTLLFHEAVCAENPPKTDSLSENQTEMIVEQICVENQNKATTLEENPTTEASLSENPTEWNIGGFYF
jgi:hypothetical protein